MNTMCTFAGTARAPSCPRFILVNDRVPCPGASCALCCETIEPGYVRSPQTRLLYCDAQCLAGHEKMTTLVVQRHARQLPRK
jgi:hypothetical protein